MPAGSIVIDLLMKTGSFSSDTARAEKALLELKKEAQAMGVVVGAAFTAVAAGAAVLAKHSIDTMDEMSKMAQKVGTTTEELSALAYAAGLADLSHEQLGSAMVKLTKNASEAANGTGDAAEAFKALGISVKNSDGSLKDSDKLIAEIANKMAGYKDGAEKTALAVALFGKAGADMIPLLNGGADGLAKATEEARKLGLVLGTETSKQAEEFNDNLTRMHAATTGIANRIVAEFLPALVEVSAMFVESAKNEEAMETKLSLLKIAITGVIGVLQTVAVVGSDVGFVFLTIGKTIGGVAAAVGALAGGSLEGFATAIRGIRSDSAATRAELDKFQAKIMGLGTTPGLDDEARRRAGHGVPIAQPRAPRLPGKDGGGAGKDPDADFKQYLNNLQQQIQKTHELSVEEKLLDDIRRGHLTVNDDQKQRLMLLAQDIDATKEAERIAKERQARRAKDDADSIQGLKDIDAAATKLKETEKERLEQLISRTPSGLFKQQQGDINFLQRSFQAGDLEAKQLAESMDLILGKTDKLGELSDDLGHIGADALRDLAIGGKSVEDVFKNMLQSVANLIFQLGVIEPMMDSLRASMKQDGGWWKTLVSAIGSAISGGSGVNLGTSSGADASLFFSDMSLDARATGGPVSANEPYMVGERGRELFIPRTAGMIVPNSALGGGGGNVTIVNPPGTPQAGMVTEQRQPNGDRVITQHLVGQIRNPNSEVSRAMQSTFGLRPKR